MSGIHWAAFECQWQCFPVMTVCKASSPFLYMHQQRQVGSKSLQQGPRPQGLPQWLRGKELACRKHEFHPWVERSPGERNGNPLQYFCREMPWTEEPCGRQSVGSERVGHNLATKQQSNREPHSEAPWSRVARSLIWEMSFSTTSSGLFVLLASPLQTLDFVPFKA